RLCTTSICSVSWRAPLSPTLPSATLFRSVAVGTAARAVALLACLAGCFGRTPATPPPAVAVMPFDPYGITATAGGGVAGVRPKRPEEHTSEPQSRENLVCRPPLVKKKTRI